MPVIVPTVERGLLDTFFCSIAIVGESPEISSALTLERELILHLIVTCHFGHWMAVLFG